MNKMLTWAANWLDAAARASRAAEQSGQEGMAHGVLAVIALHNASVAIRKQLGSNHPACVRVGNTSPDLKDARDMLSHFDEYAFGDGRLQGPAKKQLSGQATDEGNRGRQVPWVAMWSGSSGSEGSHAVLTLLTHTDDSGTARSVVVDIPVTVKVLADALDAAATDAGVATPPWVVDLM